MSTSDITTVCNAEKKTTEFQKEAKLPILSNETKSSNSILRRKHRFSKETKPLISITGQNRLFQKKRDKTSDFSIGKKDRLQWCNAIADFQKDGTAESNKETKLDDFNIETKRPISTMW